MSTQKKASGSAGGPNKPVSSPNPDQIKSIAGGATAELNYGVNDAQITGPQLHFDKNQLCMMTPVNVIAQDQVVVTNTGSATVTYDWQRITRADFISSKHSDGIQRFYCHYPHGVLKPGEVKTFTFSFRSADIQGMYFEEWQMITDPGMLAPLPMVYLSGIATQSDQDRQDMIEHRRQQVEKECEQANAQEELLDVLDKVKEPEAPQPDIRDPVTFQKFFEENNRHLGLYFTPSLMNKLFELIEDILSRAPTLDADQVFSSWTVKSIQFIEHDLLTHVQNPYTRQSFKERYMRLLSLARKVPTDRAQSYPVFRQLLLNLSEHTIDLEQKARDELQTIGNMGFVVPQEGATPEEIKKSEDERKAKKADWYKTTKKKPKTDDEELQEAEEIKHKTANSLKHELLTNKLPQVGREIDILRTKWLMQHHITMNRKQYDDLLHLESVLDIDIAGKDLIVRLDLDVPLSPYVPPPAGAEHGHGGGSLHATDDLQRSQQQTKESKSVMGGRRTAAKQQHEQPKAHVPEEPWKKREILDHTLLKRASNELRYLQQERAVNRLFVLGNLADKAGRVKPENSMRIIHLALTKQIADQPLVFVEDAVIQDFESKKENEFFPEQTTFILENLNFKPDEFGYVEPEKPQEDPHQKALEEELKRQEEEKAKEQAALIAKGAPSAKGQPPAKPGAPMDKKKEEELKKKQEEEAAAAAKKKAEELAAKSGHLSEEEKVEQQRQKEEAERKKREAEYFDYRTIHKYKELLGTYGDIYVNDAPLATVLLPHSTSLAELACPRKVLGVKMTEELRKLCHFFLKKHPREISDLWYQKPQRLATYHQKEIAVVIGGSEFKGVSEILDRILLVNAMIGDMTNEVYLAGQFGLAALNALGVKVGQFEHLSQEQLDQTSEFFKTLFAKAVQRKVKLHCPNDFLVGAHSDIELAKSEQQEYEHLLQSQQHHLAQQQLHQTQNTGNTKGSRGGNAVAPNTAGGNKQQQMMQQSHHSGATSTSYDHAKLQQLQLGQERPIRHWVDRLALQGKVREVKASIAQRWNEQVVKAVYEKYVQSGEIMASSSEVGGGELPYTEHPLTKDSIMPVEDLGLQELSQSEGRPSDHGVTSSVGGGEESQQTTHRQAAVHEDVKANEIIVEFSEGTRQALVSMIPVTFKLLWDGSLSPLCITDSVFGSSTNKQFVEHLLELRTQSLNDDEPQVTLLHGEQTEQVAKEALLRIKVEQQEALEEQKRKAREARIQARLQSGEDDEEQEDEEEDEALMTAANDGGEHSFDNSNSSSIPQGGVSQELLQLADFHCFDVPQFTMKVMQGVANKSLLSMNKHKRKTQEQVAEDLFLLEEI